MAVVDRQIWGCTAFEGLEVIDASVMLVVTSTNAEGMRRDGGSVFTAHAKPGAPNGPLEAWPLMIAYAR